MHCQYFDSSLQMTAVAEYQILDDSTQIIHIIHGESSCMSLTFWNPILMRLCILFQANVINPKITDRHDVSKSLWMIYGHQCTYKSKVITYKSCGDTQHAHFSWHRVLISWYLKFFKQNYTHKYLKHNFVSFINRN